MADEALTLRMRAYGARGTARDVNRVTRSVTALGTATALVDSDVVRASRSMNIFRRAIQLLGTRLIALTVLVVALTAVLGPPLIAAIALLTPAILAFGFAALGMFALIAVAVMRFKKQAEIGGTAAADLALVFKSMRRTVMRALGPGADALMFGLARALQTLQPVVESLRPAFTVFGQQMAFAMDVAARGLATAGPSLVILLTKLAELLPIGARMVGPLFGALVQLAIAGVPVLQAIVEALVDFSFWLGPALAAAIAWEQETGTLQRILEVFWNVISEVAAVLGDLAGILAWVYEATEPLLELVGGALLVAWNAFAEAIDWVRQNMETVGPPLLAFIATVGVLIGLIWLIVTAQAAWNAVLAVNPLVWIILGIGLLVAGLVLAYNKIGWFRDAVDWLWRFLSEKLWPILLNVADAIKNALVEAIEFVVPKIEWLIDKVKWLLDRAGDVVEFGKALVTTESTPEQRAAARFGRPVGSRAEGGPITRSGPWLVGEEGPEVVTLPRGAQVAPTGPTGDIWVAATIMMPDGEVLARQTLRAARRRKASR